MKHFFIKTMFTAAFIGTAMSAFAGGIDSKTNLSTGYHRNPSRNTEHERPEAALYNIAGTGFMSDGLFLEVGNQFVFKKYSNKYTGSSNAMIDRALEPFEGDKFEDEEKVFFYPDANIVFKKGDWAFFGGFSVAAGGGTLNYDDGTAVTTGLLALNRLPGAARDHSLEIYSVTYGETIGASYRANEHLSVAAGIRLLQTQQDLTLSSSDRMWKMANGGKKAGYHAFGMGAGGVFGVHVQPIERLDIAAQYKTITKINVEFKSIKDGLTSHLINNAKEGDHYQNDMPAELNLGIGFRIADPLYINTSFNYYFNKQAEISNALAKDSNIDYKDSWEWGGGIDWTVNDKLLVSTGVMYSHQGNSDDANNLFAPVLDCINIGAGVEVKALKEITVTAGGVYAKYFESDYTSNGLDMKLNKDVYLCSIGLTYKPF